MGGENGQNVKSPYVAPYCIGLGPNFRIKGTLVL